MRGVISAGMVWALEDLGLGDAFDAVYGSSAGAINAAYFLGGRAGLGTTIYYEDINSAKFIDLARPLRGRPIVDLGYLLDEVAVRRKVLPVDRVLASASPLTVVATDIDAGEARALRSFANAVDLVAALRASATMPVVAGGPHLYRGRRYLDASLSEPIPVPTAERDGHTHVLALLTRSRRHAAAGVGPRSLLRGAPPSTGVSGSCRPVPHEGVAVCRAGAAHRPRDGPARARGRHGDSCGGLSDQPIGAPAIRARGRRAARLRGGRRYVWRTRAAILPDIDAASDGPQTLGMGRLRRRGRGHDVVAVGRTRYTRRRHLAGLDQDAPGARSACRVCGDGN